MLELKRVNIGELIPVIKEFLEEGTCVRITVTGMSMYPFLRGEVDSVELSRVIFNQIKRGDIVLVKKEEGQYILHRVIQIKNDCFFLIGDYQHNIEGPLAPNQLIAVATAVWRREKRISCSNISWKILSELWLWPLPLRNIILKAFNILSRIRKLA